MKYASQINIVILVVALVTVGYAVSQTVWKPPVAPSFEIGGPDLTGVSSREGGEAPESAEAELSGSENLRRQNQAPRTAAFQPNREPEGISRAHRQPTTAGPQRAQPAGLYSGERNSQAGGPRVITTRPDSPPKAGDPILAGFERRDKPANRSTKARPGSSSSRAPNRVGRGPFGNATARPQAESSPRGARRNTSPPPPPSRSSNR